MKDFITIGTRGSDLALWQANYVKSLISPCGIECRIKVIKTQGDKIQNVGFDKLEGKGFFTKEIEQELLNEEIDVAVHSHKDLETTPVLGLCIAAVIKREDPSETLLIKPSSYLSEAFLPIKKNGIVGTSSSRRKAQILNIRPDLHIKDLRGNVPTRISKLDGEDYDAIVLASAGLNRLNIKVNDRFKVTKLDPSVFIPSPAQGALGIQIRDSDEFVRKIIAPLNNSETEVCINEERMALSLFKGGCQLPFGAYITSQNNQVFSWGMMKSNAGHLRRVFISSDKTQGLGERLHHQLSQSLDSKKVFISRKINEKSIINSAVQHENVTLTDRSMIEINHVKNSEIPVTDWIFFSSSNGVKHFIKNVEEVPKKVKIGCVGPATAEQAKKMGFEVDYVGRESDTRLTGKEFADMIGSVTVLFPISDKSLRTIQKEMKSSSQKAIDFICYSVTENTDVVIDSHEVYVFTSPSNVRSFFQRNVIKQGSAVIAMGQSTARELRKMDCDNIILPWSMNEQALIDTIFGVIK